MRKQITAFFAAASLLSCAAATAQDNEDIYAEDEPLLLFEITPFGGFRGGGNFDVQGSNQDVDLKSDNSLSLGLAYRIDHGQQYELFYGRQETKLDSGSPFGQLDLNVEYLHLGGTVVTNDERRVAPYIVGGLGVTRFTNDTSDSEETNFSLNVGAGLRIPFNPHFSLRLEARGFLTFMDTQSQIFCATGSFGGACAIRGSGDAFFQYDVMAGAAFAF
jgi:opacity protein-like surface antigen